jgi:peptidoglycan/xylan/chitin deacetylase (PgdA/CDA1 family)
MRTGKKHPDGRLSGRMKCLMAALLLPLFIAACSGISLREDVVHGPAIPLVTFVFDDGFDTDYLVAREVFAEQGVAACSAIATDLIDRAGFLDPGQILGLRDAGWEIMGHTASHRNLRSLSSAQVEDELFRSKTILEGMGVTVKNLVYPYNKSSEMIRAVARKYYRSARGGVDAFNRDVLEQYDLRSVSNKKFGLKQMQTRVDKAYAERDWLIIHGHRIDVKVTLTSETGTFTAGEQLVFSPSGAQGRHLRDQWFLSAGYLHFIPLAGTPQPGDRVMGASSGTIARIGKVVYNQRAEISALLAYVRTTYPDMRIVTVDAALDLLGIPDTTAVLGKKP